MEFGRGNISHFLTYNNSSSSSSHNSAHEGRSDATWLNVLLGGILLLIMLLTVIGNCLVIAVVVREKILQTVTNYFIVSLACADLLMGCVVIPFAASTELVGNHWLFGTTWCLLWQAFDVLSSTSSILNLSVIGLDRYWAIKNPISYRKKVKPRSCALMICTVWLLSILISFPAIVWWQANQMHTLAADEPAPNISSSALSTDKCVFTEDGVYLLCSSLISFYIPLGVMLVVYVSIFRTARRMIASLNAGHKIVYSKSSPNNPVVLRMHRGGQQSHRVESNYLRGHKNSPHRCCDSVSDSNLSLTAANSPSVVGKRVSKLTRERRAAKTLSIVMGIFIVCWLPFFLCNTVKAWWSPDVLMGHSLLFDIVTYLGYANSAINPVIYAYALRDFRRAFLRILCSREYLRRHVNITTHWSPNSNSTTERSRAQFQFQESIVVKPTYRARYFFAPPSSSAKVCPRPQQARPSQW